MTLQCGVGRVNALVRAIVVRMATECDWPVDDTCLPDLPAESDPGYAAAVIARDHAVQVAISVLWALSGRQFGCQTLTIRPEVGGPTVCDDAPLIDAYYRNDWRGIPQIKTSPMVVHLQGPAQEIVTVTIDGVTVPPSEYVLEGDRLYRVGKRWPYQDMSKPLGFPGTWSITYVKGMPPPRHVGGFVGQLAAEMYQACIGGKCRLPRTVVSTSRSGVTHVFDPTRMLAAGLTGIPQIDSWLAAMNPNNLAQSARLR